MLAIEYYFILSEIAITHISPAKCTHGGVFFFFWFSFFALFWPGCIRGPSCMKRALEQLSQPNEVLEWCVCWLIAGAARNLYLEGTLIIQPLRIKTGEESPQITQVACLYSETTAGSCCRHMHAVHQKNLYT